MQNRRHLFRRVWPFPCPLGEPLEYGENREDRNTGSPEDSIGKRNGSTMGLTGDYMCGNAQFMTPY